MREQQIRPQVEDGQARVAARTAELAALRARAEEVAEEVTQRGDDLSDSSSLVKIKAALASIKKELSEMDVRAGVLSTALLRSSVALPRQAKHRAKQLIFCAGAASAESPRLSDSGDLSDEEWLPASARK